MIKGKDIIVFTTISALTVTSVNAISPYSVIDITEEEKIDKLKENIYKMFNTRYTTNVAMLNNSSNSGKVAYKIKIASSLEELENAKELNSYSEFEKEFNKLYSNLKYKEKIVIRYTTTSRIIGEDNIAVDYKEQKYLGTESDVIWSVLEDGNKVGKIPLSPDTETKEPRFIKVKIGDTKLDTAKPIFRTKNGYYVDENGYSIKKVNESIIETKESLPNGIIDGYYEDTSVPLTDEYKIEVTDAIVKRADELNTTIYNVTDLYEPNVGRLTTLGNELFKYIEEKNSLKDYTVIFEGVDKYTDNPKEIYIDKNDNNSVVKYVDDKKIVDSNDLSKINIIIEEKTKDNKYIVNEIVIKPVRNAGLENILDVMVNNMKTSVFAGVDRYKTSVEVSKNGFKDGSKNLVLVSGDNEALVDGLTATPLAATLDAPILLTSKNNIPDVVIEEIERLGAKNIYIVGGENSVSSAISDKLEKYYGKNVTRIDGEDRYETSIKVSEEVVKNNNDKVDVFIVGGSGLADALSVSPVAGSKKSPIILTNKENLSIDSKYFLSKYANSTYMIGGKSHISNNISRDIVNLGLTTKRLAGSNRQDTNASIIKEFYGVDKELYNDDCIVVAKSNDGSLVDALSAGAFASKVNAPIVLAGSELSEDQEDVLISIDKKKSLVQVGYGIYNSVLDFILNR